MLEKIREFINEITGETVALSGGTEGPYASGPLPANPAFAKIRQNYEAYGFLDWDDVASYISLAHDKIGRGKIDKIKDPAEVFRKYPIEEYRKLQEQKKE